jgi:cytochrome b
MSCPSTGEIASASALVAIPPAARIKVWDPLVRLFHWTLAFGCIANLTVLREVKVAHRYVGYVILGAVVIRILWGFVGSRHARFTDFLAGPKRVAGYLAALIKGKEPRYVGHNPAGGIMMVALMGLVAICGVTGWMMGQDAFWGERWVESLHETSANVILVMATLHVLAAIVESWRHRENLIAAMVSGYKRAPSGTDVDHAPTPH